ncbi:unnamed protein product [Rhizophagus irregularis]|nr:unnamed protein product [Rhizophagus irregularis]
MFKNTPGKINFTLDAWTSPNAIGFLGITGHYIDADWNIKDILVNFVNLSGSHSGKNMANMFVTCLKEKKILTKEILKHIRAGEAQNENIILEELLEKNNKTNDIIPKTHWNSTYLMIEHALQFQKPFDETIRIEPELKGFSISSNKWQTLKELCCVFAVFYKATEEMSKSKFITLSSSIPIYNVLLDHLENLLEKNIKDHYCPIPELRSAIKKEYKKLQIYYFKMDESIVYPIATILDPRIKLKYYKQQEWEEEYINEAIKIIKKQYNENYQDDSFNNNLRAQKTDSNNFFSLFEIGDDNDSSNEVMKMN